VGGLATPARFRHRLLWHPRGAWELEQAPDAAAKSSDPAAALAACEAVSQRAAQTLEWITGKLGLLDIALDHLSLARAGLYRACLEATPPDPAPTATAVDALRRAGSMHHLPRGLLTRALLRTLIGHHTGPDSAQADLDEAWEIAERGPMPLFQADIHLHRARLFGVLTKAPYPWDSPAADLKAARHLIEQHGYLRRQAELQDAELALQSVP